MNWEGSVLNRIYKTLDFKINPPNYNKLAQNAKLSVIEKNIEKNNFFYHCISFIMLLYNRNYLSFK